MLFRMFFTAITDAVFSINGPTESAKWVWDCVTANIRRFALISSIYE